MSIECITSAITISITVLNVNVFVGCKLKLPFPLSVALLNKYACIHIYLKLIL